MPTQTTARTHFVPLLEVVDPSKCAAIARAWPHGDHVAWIQPINAEGQDAPTWAQSVRALFAQLDAQACAVVPVVTLDEDADTYATVKDIVAAEARGLVLRLDCEDALEEDSTAFGSRIDEVLRACAVAPTDCDLVVDAGLVDGGVAVQATAAATALSAVPHILQWRSLATAFSAFPTTGVSALVAVNSVGSIPRTDAAAFNHLVARWSKRPLTFADYGVGVPTYADAPWTPVPNIRYAIQGEWIVHRAATKTNPSPQYVQLAKDVTAAHYFRGAAFSDGDRYLSDVASGAGGPGNAGSYLRMAMSHHFAVVLDSLATRGAP